MLALTWLWLLAWPLARLPASRVSAASARSESTARSSPGTQDVAAAPGQAGTQDVAASARSAGTPVVAAAPRRADTPTPTPRVDWYAGGYVDYAPSGMPDFSQCRPEWGKPGNPGQWTYAGPVALADVLWWLDSANEPDPRPPSEVHDGNPLVTAYPIFGPTRDDHDLDNLFPLVEDLAVRSDTDDRNGPGATGGGNGRGTNWEDLQAGLQEYLAARRLIGSEGAYAVDIAAVPSMEWLLTESRRHAGIVLLLGVWEAQGGQLRRVGGHYAAVAGTATMGPGSTGATGANPFSYPYTYTLSHPSSYSSARPSTYTFAYPSPYTFAHLSNVPSAHPAIDVGRVALADPLADLTTVTQSGRLIPPDPAQHSCRNAPHAHDDPAVVAHDLFTLYHSPGLPGNRLALDGYFNFDTFGEAAAFVGQNSSADLAAFTAPWQHGSVVMAIDAALAIVPTAAHIPPATPTASPTASPTDTLSPSPTASPTTSPTASSTSSPTTSPTTTATTSPTTTASPTMPATATQTATSTFTPTGAPSDAPTPQPIPSETPIEPPQPTETATPEQFDWSDYYVCLPIIMNGNTRDQLRVSHRHGSRGETWSRPLEGPALVASD